MVNVATRKGWIVKLLAGLALAPLFLSAPAWACWPYAWGNVVCSNGDPAPGVAVSIYRQSGEFCGAQSYSDSTDANGEFSTCVGCAATTHVTINGETRTITMTGSTDFGTWVVSCGTDADQDGIDDDFELALAEKFSPVLHKHSFDTQPDLSDPDEVFNSGRLKIIDVFGNQIWDKPLSSSLLHATDGAYFCTLADDSYYGRMWVDFADGMRYVGAAPGSRPLFYHVYQQGAYYYVQYWYFLSYNNLVPYTDADTWHEGDWEHVTLRVSNVGGDFVPDQVNFYKHEGGHTRSAAQTWWSPTNALTYDGIQQGYDSLHTHLHVWLATDSHASYNRYDPVYRSKVSVLWGILANEEVTDNVDYSPDGLDLYFPYDLIRNMGELEYVPSNHPEPGGGHYGRTFELHRTHLPVDGEMQWLRYIGRQGDNWIGGFGCPWGTEKPQTPAPYTPATGEIAHQWLEFTVDNDLGGFGNEGGHGCFLFTKGAEISWVDDPPWGDGLCYDDDGDGYTTCNGDCNDDDPVVNPDNPEICFNGIDDDCDQLADEDCPVGDEYYPSAQAVSYQVNGFGPCMGSGMSCQTIRFEDLKPLAPSTQIVMQGGGRSGSCQQWSYRCDPEEIDVYIDDPGLDWPAACLADGESFTLDDLSRYDFRGVSTVGCTPLLFTFLYQHLCISDDDCLNGFRCEVATGMCINECPDSDGDGYTTCAGDCNDGNAAVNPGHGEV